MYNWINYTFFLIILSHSFPYIRIFYLDEVSSNFEQRSTKDSSIDRVKYLSKITFFLRDITSRSSIFFLFFFSSPRILHFPPWYVPTYVPSHGVPLNWKQKQKVKTRMSRGTSVCNSRDQSLPPTQPPGSEGQGRCTIHAERWKKHNR